MPVLRKPRFQINKVGNSETRKKNEAMTSRADGFCFSDDIKDWQVGKSLSSRKAKPLF
jgi:hypothetical protein